MATSMITLFLCADHLKLRCSFTAQSMGCLVGNPANHLSGAGCTGCANKNRAESKKLTTELFIQKAREIHGNRYGYAFSVYISSTEEIMIYCPEHGMFEQIAASHLSGKGCSVCSGNKKHDNDSFIEKP